MLLAHVRHAECMLVWSHRRIVTEVVSQHVLLLLLVMHHLVEVDYGCCVAALPRYVQRANNARFFQLEVRRRTVLHGARDIHKSIIL